MLKKCDCYWRQEGDIMPFFSSLMEATASDIASDDEVDYHDNSRVSVNAFKNSSWRNDVICIIWRRWPSSKLIEMMASYLTITSNYRNKCWFIVNYPRTCFNVVQNSNISKNTFKNVLYQSFKHYASLSIFGFGMGFGCVPNLLIMIPCAVLEPDAQFASIERFIGARLKTRICLQMWNWMVFVVRIQEIILKPVEP